MKICNSTRLILFFVFLLSCCFSFSYSFVPTSSLFTTPSLLLKSSHNAAFKDTFDKQLRQKVWSFFRSLSNVEQVSSGGEGDNHYDLVVVGAGPVGVFAACKAATSPFNKRVCLVDAPKAGGVLMYEEKDLSIGGPTGLFSKALRDTSKRIRVASLRGMGLRDDR